MKKLAWAEGYTAEELISRLNTEARHLLKDRGPEFVPDWKIRARLEESRQEYLTDTPQNRAEFNVAYASNSLMRAIRLRGTWSSGWMELAAGMAQWAMAALVEIRDLEIEIVGRDNIVASLKDEIAKKDVEIKSRDARIEQVQRNAADQEQSMDDQIHDLEHENRKLELRIVTISNELKESQRSCLEASERAHQWEAVAGTACKSAEAAATAITLMREVYMAGRNAARPDPDDHEIIVRR